METAYPWYNILSSEEDLQQGDFIQNCPIIIPSRLLEEGESVETKINLMNVIILTQSCDLAHKKIKNVYGIHYSTLENIVKKQNKRIRLLPPYREHLSQAFARYFMRVGLPQDIMLEGY